MELLKKAYFFLLDILQTLILAAAAFVVVYMFLFRPFEVKGDSMFPNFHNGQYVVTNLISLRLRDPELGETVVFESPKEPEKDFIKRVIGVKGDRVSIQDGKIYLNDQLLDEGKYLDQSIETYGGSFLQEGDSVTVPDGYFFVVGDNRSYSSDSREWGFVKKDNIIGIAVFIYWPLSDLGLIKNPY